MTSETRSIEGRQERKRAKRGAVRPIHTDEYADRVMDWKLAGLVAKFGSRDDRS